MLPSDLSEEYLSFINVIEEIVYHDEVAGGNAADAGLPADAVGHPSLSVGATKFVVLGNLASRYGVLTFGMHQPIRGQCLREHLACARGGNNKSCVI